MTEFKDAEAMQRNSPATFKRPGKDHLAAVSVGDYVKVCANQERFWVIVSDRDGDSFNGSVDSLTVMNDLELGDEVHFETRHIYGILNRKDAQCVKSEIQRTQQKEMRQ